MSKADELEVELRIEEVYQLLTKGASSNHVIEHCREKWGVRKAQSYKYIKRAKEQIAKIVEKNLSTALQEALSLYDELIHRCLFEGTIKYTSSGDEYRTYDYQTARHAINDKMKLLGLTGADIQISISTPEEKAIAAAPTEKLLEQYEELH